MRALASALAEAGFTAYMPIIEEIETLKLKPAVPIRIGHFLQCLAEREQQPVGLVAASIAAGMSIVSVARPEVRACVHAMLAIGAYGDLSRTVDHVMQHSSDAYGRNVIWMNYAEHLFGPSPTLVAAFRAAIDDDGWKRDPPQLPEVLANGDPLERSLFRRLTEDATFAEMHWRDVRRALEKQGSDLQSMDALQAVEGLRCPLYLLHGELDDVIPASESKALYARMREAQVPGRLLVTPLLSHADPQLGPAFPLHAARLINLFGRFFSDLEKGHGAELPRTLGPSSDGVNLPLPSNAVQGAASVSPNSGKVNPSIYNHASPDPPYRRVSG
jgi:pimeloyl-ACP methyl ester carboxylesterase